VECFHHHHCGGGWLRIAGNPYVRDLANLGSGDCVLPGLRHVFLRPTLSATQLGFVSTARTSPCGKRQFSVARTAPIHAQSCARRLGICRSARSRDVVSEVTAKAASRALHAYKKAHRFDSAQRGTSAERRVSDVADARDRLEQTSWLSQWQAEARLDHRSMLPH
jgi:hypothetical protein